MPRAHPVKVTLAQRGETQRACAAAVHVSPQTLNGVLNGSRAPWPALRRRLADHLGREEADLFPDVNAAGAIVTMLGMLFLFVIVALGSVALPPDVMTLPQAAKRLGLGAKAAYEQAARGQFPGAFRVGRNRWRVSVPKFEREVHGTEP